METATKVLIKGGEFILKEAAPESVFTPEEYNEEQRMFRKAMRDFLDKEVEPLKEQFDSVAGTKLAPALLEKMGDLGFFGIAIPEQYGGLNYDFKTDLAFGEIASDSFAFSQSIGVQSGLAIYPILLYGTEEQKEKYLPPIVAGKTKLSYCLTEPSAGSDANSGKTKAVLSEDQSHFILNGQKMWITNSGFADVFAVFCKIEEDENLSCLIVEKEWGVTLGAEERKMGIHGSSTRQVFFENVKVPIANLLGTRNKGFKIAMNALNGGRIKIAVACTAIAKRAFRLAVQHANQRVQFKQAIANFGAIQHKIALMATRIYALESSWNRAAHQVDEVYEALLAQGTDPLAAKIQSLAEFAIECAITKVYGSEVEQFVVDEALQIHGGMGYSAESEISTHYRNIRGNRIYEGTNEINRILIPTMLLRKAMKGEMPLMEAAMNTFEEVQRGAAKPAIEGEQPYELAQSFLANAKKAFLLIAGQSVQHFQQKIKEEQEVLMNLSDIISQIYILESTLLRTMKHTNRPSASVRNDMLMVLLHESAELFSRASKEVIAASASGDMALMTMKTIHRLLRLPIVNLKEKRRAIAAYFRLTTEYQLS